MNKTKKTFYPHDYAFPNEPLSVSQIGLYCRCRKAWRYHYLDKIHKKRTAPYLMLGKLVHEGIAEILINKFELQDETYGIGYTKVAELTRDYLDSSLEYTDTLDELQRVEFIQQTRDIEANANRIIKRLMGHFELDKWDIVECDGIPMVEAHFGVPIRKNRYMHGFIDLIAKNRDSGQVWLIDWKVRKSLAPIEDEMYNIQNAVYCYALKDSGIPVVGSITYQALSAPMTIPKLNKNGTVSMAKIRCTWQEYADFCVANGQDPASYIEEMKPKLDEIEWVRPVVEYRSEFIMKNIWNNVIKGIASEIHSKRSGKKYPAAITPMNCKSCEYSVLCQHEIRGYDVEFIMEEEYRVDTHGDTDTHGDMDTNTEDVQ